MRIMNIYIETPNDLDQLKILTFLMQMNFKFFDASKYDAYTSGPCKVETVEEIKNDITR